MNTPDMNYHQSIATSDDGPLLVNQLMQMISECSPGGDAPLKSRKLVVLLNAFYRNHYEGENHGKPRDWTSTQTGQ